MPLRALRWLFAVYVLLLCALAISDESMERGGALFLLIIGLVLLVRDIDIGIIPEPGATTPSDHEADRDSEIAE
ncbi:MAG: hypothetical protein M3R24_32745 [Chloroflexota bacterium]|nr:hypothetical protein [Chloroflexota bacterium]